MHERLCCFETRISFEQPQRLDRDRLSVYPLQRQLTQHKTASALVVLIQVSQLTEGSVEREHEPFLRISIDAFGRGP